MSNNIIVLTITYILILQLDNNCIYSEIITVNIKVPMSIISTGYVLMSKLTKGRSKMTTFENAKNYVSRGFSVIPLKPKGKKPAIKSWTPFQARKPTDEELQKWFGNGSNSNIGIVTGKISGIAVVDLDSKKAVKFADKNFEKTPKVKTGKGFHLYFKDKEGVRNFQKRDDLPGIDLRGEGGYVVAPPSIHSSGKQYSWVDGYGLADIPFAELPSIILAEKNDDKTPIKTLLNGVPEGSRNESLTRIAGRWIYDGLSLQECIEKARFWNKNNHPPLPDKEIVKPIESLYKKHQKQEKCFNKNIKSIYKGNKDEGVDNIVKQLNKNYVFKSIRNKRDSEIYVYKDGIYVEKGEEIIESFTEDSLKELNKPYDMNRVIKRIACSSYIDRKELGNVDKKYICLNNGILDIDNMNILPHDPEFIFMTKIPVNYNPDAKCDFIDETLAEILNPADVELIKEWMGYALFRSHFIKKAIMLVGKKNTGKSTLLNLIRIFFGDENISGVSLQDLVKNRFAGAQLYNKHLNIYDDLSDRDVKDSSFFKIATGDYPVTAEHKFKDRFSFHNYAKMTFSANRIPRLKQEDDAFFERWIIIEHNNEFPDNNPNTNKMLINRVINKDEFSGLLNQIIKKLQVLIQTQKFSYSLDSDAIRNIWLIHSTTVYTFIRECCDEKLGAFISKRDLYDVYVKYIKQHGGTMLGYKSFGMDLKMNFNYVVDCKDKIGTRGWKHIALKKNIKFEEYDFTEEDEF
jgi:putative DNA primase/helicase